MGLIYFIQSGESGPIKIGYAERDAKARLSTLQTGSPIKLYLRRVVLGPRSDERALHVRFKDHRLAGEWFSPEPDLLSFVESLPDEIPHPVFPPHPISSPPVESVVIPSVSPEELQSQGEALGRQLFMNIESFINLILDLREARREGRTDFDGSALELMDYATGKFGCTHYRFDAES